MPLDQKYRGVVLKVQGVLPKARWARLASALAGLTMLGFAFAQPAARPRREITLTSQSVPLSLSEATLDHAGSLRFLGGLWLKSEDPDFGGISGLAVREQAGEVRITAVTDQGDLLSARLQLSDGRLRGVDAASLERLNTPEGTPITGKAAGDAESVARPSDGRLLVAFEQKHRVWSYSPDLTGPVQVFEIPTALAKAPRNGGLESMAAWPDGRVILIAEQQKTERGSFAAYLFKSGSWTTLEWTGSAPGFEPSDATVMPGGDLLILERYWSALAPLDLRSRVVRVKGDAITPGATLQGELVAEFRAPLTVENFEGIAAWSAADGTTRILLGSDNNFNDIQRTLLLEFALDAKALARP
jgi:hypothetical protein